MKIRDKNVYCEWDSPHTFCEHQLDDEEYGLQCSKKLFDDDTNDPEKCKCLFIKKTAKKCMSFVYHKHDKNPDAKRYTGHKI